MVNEIEWSPGTPMTKEFAVEFLKTLKSFLKTANTYLGLYKMYRKKMYKTDSVKEADVHFNMDMDMIDGTISLLDEKC